MTSNDWRDEPVLPEQTSDDTDDVDPERVNDEDLERLLREVTPHHGN